MFRDDFIKKNYRFINSVLQLYSKSKQGGVQYNAFKSIVNYESMCSAGLIEYSESDIFFLLVYSSEFSDNLMMLLSDEISKEILDKRSGKNYLNDLLLLINAADVGKYDIYKKCLIDYDGVSSRVETLKKIRSSGLFGTKYFRDEFEDAAMKNVDRELTELGY